MHEAAETPRRRIRLLFLIPSFHTGGAELQLLSLVRGLDRRRFQVAAAAFYRGGTYDEAFAAVPDTELIFLGKRGPWDLRPLPRLIAYLRRRPADVLQAINVSTRLIGILAAKAAHVPVVIAAERTGVEHYSSWGSRVYQMAEKYALRLADCVATNSEAGRRLTEARGVKSERIRVIYNGVDEERLPAGEAGAIRRELGLPESAFVIASAMRFEPVKDPLRFVDLAAELRRAGEEVYGLAIGEGSLWQEARRRAAEKGVEKVIVFTGGRTDAPRLLQAADVVVSTSTRIEGCSNVLLEAMALGKAVVAGRVGGNEEIIEHERTGLLVDATNLAETAAAVIRLRNDPAFRRRLGERAQMVFQNRFTQAAMVRAYEALYQELVEKAMRGSSK